MAWWTAYEENDSVISVYFSRRIEFAGDDFAPYVEWPYLDNSIPDHRNAVIGFCGAVYPPAFLNELQRRGELFRKTTPRQDDVWLTFVAVTSGFPVRQIRSYSGGSENNPRSRDAGPPADESRERDRQRRERPAVCRDLRRQTQASFRTTIDKGASPLSEPGAPQKTLVVPGRSTRTSAAANVVGSDLNSLASGLRVGVSPKVMVRPTGQHMFRTGPRDRRGRRKGSPRQALHGRVCNPFVGPDPAWPPMTRP